MQRRRSLVRILLVLALLPVAGCGGSATPMAPAVTAMGDWRGTTQVGPLDISIFIDNGGSLTGAGTLTSSMSPGFVALFDVSGSRVGYAVQLTLTPTNLALPPVYLTGTITGSAMPATLNGDWFAGDTVRLARQ